MGSLRQHFPTIKTGAERLLLVGLMVLVSGLAPIAIQTYGWVEMTRSEGGILSLSKVISGGVAPCRFCEIAGHLSDREDSDTPLPYESMKGQKLGPSSTTAMILVVPGKEWRPDFEPVLSILCPMGPDSEPVSPPPRSVS